MPILRDPNKDLSRQGVDPVSLQAALTPTPTPTPELKYTGDPDVERIKSLLDALDQDPTLQNTDPELVRALLNRK